MSVECFGRRWYSIRFGFLIFREAMEAARSSFWARAAELSLIRGTRGVFSDLLVLHHPASSFPGWSFAFVVS